MIIIPSLEHYVKSNFNLVSLMSYYDLMLYDTKITDQLNFKKFTDFSN